MQSSKRTDAEEHALSPELHWSFDYTRFNGDAFRAELMASLETAYAGGLPSGPTTDYIVLPNYWQGYRGRTPEADDGPELAFGSICVERTDRENEIDWCVESYQHASGETLEFRFQTDASPLRRLKGEWHIDATNCAEGEYSEFHAVGRLDDSRGIRLTVGDISCVADEVRDDRPLLCNWTLCDVVPELARLPEGAEFAILDDLEKLRPRCRIRPLDTCCLSLTTGDLELQGFVVFGEAQTPGYYWLDANSNVAITSSTFQTFVLRCAGGES